MKKLFMKIGQSYKGETREKRVMIKILMIMIEPLKIKKILMIPKVDYTIIHSINYLYYS